MLAFVAVEGAPELPAVVEFFFAGWDIEADEDAGCALVPVPLLADATVGLEFAAGRTSGAVDNTISAGALAGRCTAVSVDAWAAGPRAGATAATDGATFLLTGRAVAAAGAETGAGAGTGFDATLTEAEFDATITGAGAAATGFACAFAAACARVAAKAGGLLLSSSNGGRFGKVLSGT